jgi:1-acyl-sn-glycerol-3-phosphate acyltransferase
MPLKYRIYDGAIFAMIYEPPDLDSFQKPSLSVVRALTLPLRLYFPTKSFGLEHIKPHGRYLFVGNHTIYGGLDWPLLIAEVYEKTGLFLRSLADHAHFEVPLWRLYVHRLGVVHGTRKNCAYLMERNEPILVYPGGTREICKRKGEEYRLTWKKRTGFVEMAILHRYAIVPFASVGPDHAYTILWDANDILQSWIGRWLTRTGVVSEYLRGGDVIPPISRGVAFTPCPRPEPFYFSFARPISTAAFRGKLPSAQKIWTFRERVAQAIYKEIERMLAYREQDADRGLVRRWLSEI